MTRNSNEAKIRELRREIKELDSLIAAKRAEIVHLHEQGFPVAVGDIVKCPSYPKREFLVIAIDAPTHGRGGWVWARWRTKRGAWSKRPAHLSSGIQGFQKIGQEVS